MPSLDCGCNIIVGMMNDKMILQAEHCHLHGAAGDLRESMIELIKCVDDSFNLNGLRIEQVAEFRGCLGRAKSALIKSGGGIITRSNGESNG